MKYYGKIQDPKDLVTKEYVDDGVSGKENKGKITINGVEKTASSHIVTIVTNGETTTMTLVGVG